MISPSGLLKALLVSFLLAVSSYAVSKLNLFGMEGASDRLACLTADQAARIGPRTLVYLDMSPDDL